MSEMRNRQCRSFLLELRGRKEFGDAIRAVFAADSAKLCAESFAGAVFATSARTIVATAIISVGAICPTANAASFAAKIKRIAKFATRRLCCRYFCCRNREHCMDYSFRCSWRGKGYPNFAHLGRFVDYGPKLRFGCEKKMENNEINENNGRGDEC